MESKKEDKGKGESGSNLQPAFEVTGEGSLGLLALGAVGIKAWREKREEEKLKSDQSSKK